MIATVPEVWRDGLRVLAAALLTAAGLGLGGCGEAGAGSDGSEEADDAEAPTPIAAVELSPRDLSRQMNTSATVEPRRRTRLASRMSGTLQAVHYEEGDWVEQGDLLAQLDTAEAEAELERALAQEQQAKQEYERMAELRSQQLVSTSEYENQQTLWRVAQSERRLWETRVAFGRVTAPRDAMVTARYVEPGEAVEAQGVLFELTAMDELVLRLGVSELDVTHLSEGQAVPVRLDAMPEQEFEGAVRRILPQADQSSRLVTVEVALAEDAYERGIRPGYLARVRMPIDPRPDVIAVPSSAIGEEGDERYVFVVEQDALTRRVIEPGVARGQWTEVVAGLEAGEIVLATNPIDMRDGEPVRIVGWRG